MDNVTITVTAEEARTIKYLIIKEERHLDRQNQNYAHPMEEEIAEVDNLTALRQKIHDQI